MLSSIHKAIRVINMFSEQQQQLGVGEISTSLGIPTSSAHHIIKTLAAEGILVKTNNRKYRLGSQLLRWGETVYKQYEPFFLTTPYIEQVSKSTNEVVHLGVLENDKVCFLVKAKPRNPIRIETALGTRMPIHCTSLGKILASFHHGKNQHFFPAELKRFTPNTIIDKTVLFKQLNEVRQNGFAIDNEEYEIGLYCVGVPIRNYLGNTIAAISISGPEVRLKPIASDLVQKLKITADRISKQLDL